MFAIVLLTFFEGSAIDKSTWPYILSVPSAKAKILPDKILASAEVDS